MKRDKLDRRREGLNLAAKIRTLWMERFAQDLFQGNGVYDAQQLPGTQALRRE